MTMPPLDHVCAWCANFSALMGTCRCPCLPGPPSNSLTYAPSTQCDCRHFTLIGDAASRKVALAAYWRSPS